MSTGMPELGSKISLISKADIRYEGRLFTVDPQECTIALASGKFDKWILLFSSKFIIFVYFVPRMYCYQNIVPQHTRWLEFCRFFVAICRFPRYVYLQITVYCLRKSIVYMLFVC